MQGKPSHSHSLLVGAASPAPLQLELLGLRDENFKDLSAQVDTRLSHLENSTSCLEAQLDSLARVVLQNGRGLNLLFMRQGAVSRTLGETRSFSVNQSGRIREGL